MFKFLSSDSAMRSVVATLAVLIFGAAPRATFAAPPPPLSCTPTQQYAPFIRVEGAAGKNLLIRDGSWFKIKDLGADLIPGTPDDGGTYNFPQIQGVQAAALASTDRVPGRYFVYAQGTANGLELYSIDSLDGVFGNGNDLPATLQGRVPSSTQYGNFLTSLYTEGTRVTLGFGGIRAFVRDLTAPVTTNIPALALPTGSVLQGNQFASGLGYREHAAGTSTYTITFFAANLSFGIFDDPTTSTSFVFDGSAGDGYKTDNGGSAFLHLTTTPSGQSVALSEVLNGVAQSTTPLASVPTGRRPWLVESSIGSKVALNGQRLATWLELPPFTVNGPVKVVVSDANRPIRGAVSTQLANSMLLYNYQKPIVNGDVVYINAIDALGTITNTYYLVCH